MESPEKRLLRLLVEHDPASPEFRSEFRDASRPGRTSPSESTRRREFQLWHDVFVQQTLPWGRFLQSALLHAMAVALVWAVSLSWIRQQRILDHAAFDPSSLVTYTPEEYLPPLDTGASEAPKAQKGDPVYAKQPILSVPPGSGQPVPNHRRAARSQARPRRGLAQHHCHGSHRSGGSAGCDASPVAANSRAGDAGRGARARRAVCAGPRGSSGDEIGRDRTASGS